MYENKHLRKPKLKSKTVLFLAISFSLLIGILMFSTNQSNEYEIENLAVKNNFQNQNTLNDITRSGNYIKSTIEKIAPIQIVKTPIQSQQNPEQKIPEQIRYNQQAEYEQIILKDSSDEQDFQMAFNSLVKSSQDDPSYIDLLVNQYTHYYSANNIESNIPASILAVSSVIDDMVTAGKAEFAIRYGEKFNASMSGSEVYLLSMAQAYGVIASSKNNDYTKPIEILNSISNPSDEALVMLGMYYNASRDKANFERITELLKEKKSPAIRDLESLNM